MFEDWPEEQPSPRRVVDPPKPVTVDLGLAIPGDGNGFGVNGVPLRVRAGGLVVSGRVPGLLRAWARTNSGGWLGLVDFTLSTSNGRGHVRVRQWCSSRAVQKADDQ
ncbi:hypothetical protein [Nocardia vinacea]|uniref:hypothetical protein n=1 Tax=Nocardia vinacea TaxID=96468 RepID=UPI000308A104|nr:hypothetical protein [Nocardia vinacea]